MLARTTTDFHFPQGPSGIPEVPISGIPSPPSSPPLAAFTSSNELAIKPKPKRNTNGNGDHSAARNRRGGATLRIREECERFFCETMQAVFGERNSARHGSGLTSVHQRRDHQQPSSNRSRDYHHQQDDESDTASSVTSIDSGYFGSFSADTLPPVPAAGDKTCSDSPVEVTAWMEIWDYQGGASFRAFVAEDVANTGEKALFTFFGAGVVGRDLKKALVALIELAETALGCARLVVCVDRATEEEELAGLTKGLQWAGFELETLDQWAGIRDVTSGRWIYMGMEV